MRFKTETLVGLFVLTAIVIFLYMGFQIGALRLDRPYFNSYVIYFSDISGLAKKADVKIAGVKVGWIESVDLVNDTRQVQVTAMVRKEYNLYSDAYGIVRQEGLLGAKYLEIIPGDSLLPTIPAGGTLMKPSADSVSFDDLLSDFQTIAKNVQDVTASLKEVFGGVEGVHKLNEVMNNFTDAAARIADFAQNLDRVVVRNEQNIDTIFSDFGQTISELKHQLPLVAEDIRTMMQKIGSDVVPSIREGADGVTQLMNNLNEGKGVIGRLVTNEELAEDVRTSLEGLRLYFDQIDKLGVVFDMWGESMQGRGQHLCIQDTKGYFNVRVHPTEDYFYILGVTGSNYGIVRRFQTFRSWEDSCGVPINPDSLHLTDRDKLKFAPQKNKIVREYDALTYNLQFAKVFSNVAFRAGLFESTFGVGVDLDIPLDTTTYRWVSTLEMFDFRGRLRVCDDRPHLKWLNKIFFTQNIYFVAGFDDFVSRDSKNAFVGVGLRFADDDVKYLVSKVTVNA